MSTTHKFEFPLIVGNSYTIGASDGTTTDNAYITVAESGKSVSLDISSEEEITISNVDITINSPVG